MVLEELFCDLEACNIYTIEMSWFREGKSSMKNAIALGIALIDIRLRRIS